MPIFVALCAILLLSACSDEPRYLSDRIVKDRDGCAFMIKPALGDAVHVNFIRDASDPATCAFPKSR